MNAKILIIDDSSLARRTLRQVLEGFGHTVDEASDGTVGLERYHIGAPDLVILDMVMSGMYGLDVLTQLRAMNPEVKVIVATADIQTSTAAQVREAGAKAILNKPVNREKLAAILENILAGGDAWN